ncbi:MAG: hypothetical protein AB8B50_15075 [Pirellulaceae bacterium]
MRAPSNPKQRTTNPTNCITTLLLLVAFTFPALASPRTVQSAEPERTSKKDIEPVRKAQSNDKDVAKIDLFLAIAREQIEVRFIPQGSTKATIVFENKTDEAIDIDLPDAFGAVHVLGQFGQGPGGGFGQGAGGGFGQGAGAAGFGQGAGAGGGAGQGGGQNVGGGFFGGQAGGGQGAGNNAGGGFFRVEPDKKRRLTTSTVCLQFGHKDPTPRMKYELVPISAVSQNPLIQELCHNLGRQTASQSVSQAVAWHLQDDLSFADLGKLNLRESRYTGEERRFTRRQLESAKHYLSYLHNESATESATNATDNQISEDSTNTRKPVSQTQVDPQAAYQNASVRGTTIRHTTNRHTRNRLQAEAFVTGCTAGLRE